MKMINGTWQHLIMGIVTVFVSKWLFGHVWEAVVMMVTIEAVQIDIFTLRGRELDTAIDLLADLVGGLIGYAVWLNLLGS